MAAEKAQESLEEYTNQGERLDFWMQLASGEDNERLKKEFIEVCQSRERER